MTTQAQRIVRIEHPDGRRYAVTEAAFLHTKQPQFDGGTYQDAGFKIVSYEDGTAYEEGSEPTAYALVGAYGSPEIGEVAADAPTTRTAAASSHAAQTMSGASRREATASLATDDSASSPAESAQSS